MDTLEFARFTRGLGLGGFLGAGLGGLIYWFIPTTFRYSACRTSFIYSMLIGSFIGSGIHIIIQSRAKERELIRKLKQLEEINKIIENAQLTRLNLSEEIIRKIILRTLFSEPVENRSNPEDSSLEVKNEIAALREQIEALSGKLGETKDLEDSGEDPNS